MLKFCKNQAGFTLIELLVAIGIFTLLSSFLIVSYRGNEKLRDLKNQAQEAVSGLQKVQNMALTGESVNGETPLSYRFSISNCASDCVYKLTAVFDADPDNDMEISEKSLSTARITNVPAGGLMVDFSAPRGKMALSDDQETAAFEIGNDEGIYCIRLNSVSGRIDPVFGLCP